MRIFAGPCEHTIGGGRRCVKRRASNGCGGNNADCCCRVVGLQPELFRVNVGLALRPTQLGEVTHPHRPGSVHVAEVSFFLFVVGLLNHVVRVRHFLEAKLCAWGIDMQREGQRREQEKGKQKKQAKSSRSKGDE